MPKRGGGLNASSTSNALMRLFDAISFVTWFVHTAWLPLRSSFKRRSQRQAASLPPVGRVRRPSLKAKRMAAGLAV